MKGLVTWLLGDELGKLTINSFKWLLEVPTDRSATKGKTSDEIDLEHIAQLLESMRSKVVNLQQVVDRVRHSTKEIQNQYDLKYQYHQELMWLVAESKRLRNIVEARLAMAKAIEIERILPEFEAKLERSQEMLIKISEIYTQKESELSLLEIDMENMKTYMAMNDSIDGHHDIDKSHELTILQEKIRNSSIEAEDRCREIQIASQLSHPSNCELGETLTTKDIDDRIESISEERKFNRPILKKNWKSHNSLIDGQNSWNDPYW
jgi:phage shock protein A